MRDLTRDPPDMEAELRALIAEIPPGRVATCGALAEALGSPMAARWVGQFVLHHEHRPQCACHRVVRAGGKLGPGGPGGVDQIARRLRAEGVAIVGASVDLGQYGLERLPGTRPLGRLREVQEAITRQVSTRGLRRVPDLVAGVDVSYPSPGCGVAAYALVETQSGRLAWSKKIGREVRFPYITTFLGFRELPILLDLLEEVRAEGRLARVVLVDGSGVLHPRRAGIASHLGVAAELSTIGVTKKLLCGQVDIEGMAPREPRAVSIEGRQVGAAIRPTSGSRRPIFVSPGHRVSRATAETVVLRLLRGRRLPEPLYWADRLSRQHGG